MADEQLFEGLPEQERPQAEGRGALRLREPERSQIGMQVAAVDDLILEGHPGRSGWAFVDGIGSARKLDRLCRDHLVYRWLCGGVSMNYHSLSNFRTAHMAVLERLLAQGVASMVQAGLVSVDTLAQDGLRVRAGAGASSFRRRPRLDDLHAAAQTLVERLRAEVETDPAGGA